MGVAEALDVGVVLVRGLLHEVAQGMVVLGLAGQTEYLLVDGEAQLLADEVEQPLGALLAQSLVVLVGTFGRGGTPDHHVHQLQAVVVDPWQHDVLQFLQQLVVGQRLRLVHGKAYRGSGAVEHLVRELHAGRCRAATGGKHAGLVAADEADVRKFTIER